MEILSGLQVLPKMRETGKKEKVDEQLGVSELFRNCLRNSSLSTKIVSAIFGVHLKKEIFQILGKAMLFQRRGIYDSSELQIVNLQRLGIRNPLPTDY